MANLLDHKFGRSAAGHTTRSWKKGFNLVQMWWVWAGLVGVGLFLLGRVWSTWWAWYEVPIAPENSPRPSEVSPLSSLLQESVAPTPQIPELPTRKQLTGGQQVFQTFNNCGPAALSMALSYQGVRVTQQELAQALRPYQHTTGDNDDKSVTLAELAVEAEKYGFVAYHRPGGEIELIKQFIAADIPVITRTLLTSQDDIGHYRVVIGYDDVAGHVTQDDSLQGAKLNYAYDDFLTLWRTFNYEYLILARPEHVARVTAILGTAVDEKVAWQMALARAEQESSAVPTDWQAQFNRVIALYHLERYEEARAIYEGVAARLPKRALWYQIEPLLIYYQLGEYNQVLKMADSILTDQNRAYSELYELKSRIFEQRGELQQAAEARDEALRYNSTASYMINLK